MNKDIPKGYKIHPEPYGARFETPTTFGLCTTTEIALEEIRREIETGEPAWRIQVSTETRSWKRRFDLKHFKLCWRDGTDDIIEGRDISDAMNRAGLEQGALPTLDHWEEMNEDAEG